MAVASAPARSILPPRLDALLEALVVTDRRQVIVRGWSADCERDEHRLERWLAGFYSVAHPAFPGIRHTFSLVLLVCTACETVEVRDRTRDELVDGTRVIAAGRRDGLLGWYSGARRSQRVYL